MTKATYYVNIEDNPGLKRRLELLDASPIMKKIEGLTPEEIGKLPKEDRDAVVVAVENAIKQAQIEESIQKDVEA
jgi:hypothetical protein